MLNPTIFITHLPSSYKVNLYSRLQSHDSVEFSVIYCGRRSRIRSHDFTLDSQSFDHCFLFGHDFESRPVIATCFKLLYTLITSRPRLIFINGWDLRVLNRAHLFLFLPKETYLTGRRCTPTPFYSNYC